MHVPIDRKMENAKITSIANIINNAFRDQNLNIKENEFLAIILGYLIESLDLGIFPPKRAITYLLNKSMETTKSDPYAELGHHDPLLEIAQFINRTDTLPTRNTELSSVLLKVFQEEFLGSTRRHYKKRDVDKTRYINKIFSSYGFIDTTVIYPDEQVISSKEKKKNKKNKFKKLEGEN